MLLHTAPVGGTAQRRLLYPHRRGTDCGIALAGFFVWNTPIAVRVQRRGHTAVQRVYDVTRLAQLAFALLAVILVLIMRQERKQPSA